MFWPRTEETSKFSSNARASRRSKTHPHTFLSPLKKKKKKTQHHRNTVLTLEQPYLLY